MDDIFGLGNKKALNYLDSALYYNPENLTAHFLFGKLHINKNPTLGEKHLKRSFGINPNYLPTLIALTDYYFDNNNEEATIKYTSLALEQLKNDNSYINPTTKIDLFFKKGEALFYSNQVKESIIALDSVLTLDTIEFNYKKFALYTRGVCYNDLEEYDKAFDDLAFTAENFNFKKDPFLTYHLALAYTYKVKPDVEKALYYINISTKLTKKDSDAETSDLDLCYVLRGEIYMARKEYQSSINEFLKLEEDENQNFWLGMVHYKAKIYSKSLKYYLSHLKDFPDDLEALTETANCYYQLGNLTKACEYISESIEYYSVEAIEEAEDLQKVISFKNTYCK